MHKIIRLRVILLRKLLYQIKVQACMSPYLLIVMASEESFMFFIRAIFLYQILLRVYDNTVSVMWGRVVVTIPFLSSLGPICAEFGALMFCLALLHGTLIGLFHML